MVKVIVVSLVNRAYGIITIIQNYFLSIITSVHRDKVFRKEFCFHLINGIAFAGLVKMVLASFQKSSNRSFERSFERQFKRSFKP